MKRLLLCAFVAALPLTAGAQADSESSVVVRGTQLQRPAEPFQLYHGAMTDYTGSYDLSTGEQMAIRQMGYRLYLTMGNGERKPLIAVARNVLMSTDNQVKLVLQRQDDGEYSGHMWRARPDLSARRSMADSVPKYELVSFR
jgi:hypothetical protein